MWYSNLAAVGINEIDADHANIDYMIRTISRVGEKEPFIKQLVSAFIAHMKHEEGVIECKGEKFPDDHKKEHVWMEIVLRSLETELAEDKIDPRAFAQEIRSILALHVLDFDIRLSSLSSQQIDLKRVC